MIGGPASPPFALLALKNRVMEKDERVERARVCGGEQLSVERVVQQVVRPAASFLAVVVNLSDLEPTPIQQLRRQAVGARVGAGEQIEHAKAGDVGERGAGGHVGRRSEAGGGKWLALGRSGRVGFGSERAVTVGDRGPGIILLVDGDAGRGDDAAVDEYVVRSLGVARAAEEHAAPTAAAEARFVLMLRRFQGYGQTAKSGKIHDAREPQREALIRRHVRIRCRGPN
jgi:hypothetical protein